MSKKIMFNDKYGLTEAVLNNKKTQTRRLVPNGTPIGNWAETETHAHFKVGEVVAIAQNYQTIFDKEGTLHNTWLRDIPLNNPGWKNKMFVKPELMPHHIRITNIHIERLNDISDDDCLKEGVYKVSMCDRTKYFSCVRTELFNSPREAYAVLIDKVTSRGTWNNNPYVFVYDFELID